MINEKLFKAVETGKADEVEKALTEEKINAATYYGAKSIVLAAEQGNFEILKMLLKNGEKINRESFWRRTAFSALRAAKNTENPEILELLLEYGAGLDKKRLESALNNTHKITNTNTTKFCREDGIYIPQKSSKDCIIVQYAKEGRIKKVKELLEEGVSEKAFSSAADAVLEKNDTEKIKFYLEKLIENTVGFLTDETGKSTLEIALENPNDLIKILSNYGFHENSLQYAYRCLSNVKKNGRISLE
jgi:hypothetical protein